MSKVVIALGGNALGDTPEEQQQLIAGAAKSIVDMAEKGHQVVIAHGNGPQVGTIIAAMESAAISGAVRFTMPFPECGAMSQGYIGYHLQKGIRNELKARGMNRSVATVITQTIVDPQDPAFQTPTKPIGVFYTEEQARQIEKEKGYTMVEDAGRGYRRVVASPKPVDVVEKAMISDLVDAGHLVITVGGGGIPVIEKDGVLEGVPAVIDKDYASSKLAEVLHADMLVILTAVERVAINFGQPNQKTLEQMTLSEAEQYCAEGHFAPGSMLPKVRAAMAFAKSGGTAIIAALENAEAALEGKSGTRVVAG